MSVHVVILSLTEDGAISAIILVVAHHAELHYQTYVVAVARKVHQGRVAVAHSKRHVNEHVIPVVIRNTIVFVLGCNIELKVLLQVKIINRSLRIYML